MRKNKILNTNSKWFYVGNPISVVNCRVITTRLYRKTFPHKNVWYISIVQKSQIYTQKYKILDNIYFRHSDFIMFLRFKCFVFIEVFKLFSLFYINDIKHTKNIENIIFCVVFEKKSWPKPERFVIIVENGFHKQWMGV